MPLNQTQLGQLVELRACIAKLEAKAPAPTAEVVTVRRRQPMPPVRRSVGRPPAEGSPRERLRLPDRPPVPPAPPAPEPAKVTAKQGKQQKQKKIKQPPPPPKTAAERRERFLRKLAKDGLTWDDINTLTALLMEKYPEVFGARRKPLAVGIHHAIIAEMGCNPRALSIALRQWCSHRAYLAALANGTHRYGLDGSPAAELTDADRAAAQQKLQRRR